MDRAGSRITNDVAYLQELSRHKQFTSMSEQAPTVDNAWVAPNASLSKSHKLIIHKLISVL